MLAKRKALVAVLTSVSIALLAGCSSNKEEENKRVMALEEKVSGIEKRLQKFPQQQDLAGIKESIQSVKPQLERLEPLLGAFLIKREPGEREEQWRARVKQRLTESYSESLPGSAVVSNERNCEGGVRLAVLAVKPSRRDTTVYLEFNGRVDADVHVDVKGIYITDNPGHRYRLISFDRTHLTTNDTDQLLRLHAGERIVTHLLIPQIDITAKAFQLYWPGCGIIDFTPKTVLAAE